LCFGERKNLYFWLIGRYYPLILHQNYTNQNNVPMKKLIFTILIAGVAWSSHAQMSFISNQIKIVSGELRFLKSASHLLLEYDYDNMMVGTMKEADYIARSVAEKNKAKAGSGDEWQGKWVSDRKAKFEPGFEKRFIKHVSKAGITAGQNVSGAKYKLILKTLVTEPGFYTGVSTVKKPTFVTVEACFVDVDEPDVVLCKIACSQIIGEAGSISSYDVANRINAAYENLGNRLGPYLVKTLKKIK
jgi:hypothetical protein